jgi:hypothetical protein
MCFACLAFIAISSITLIFAATFQCIPVNFIWDGWRNPHEFSYHSCLNMAHLSVASGISYVVQDIIILVLPAPILYKLNVPLRSKIEMFSMFGIGIFIVITSCIRLQYAVKLSHTRNPTWDYVDVMLWGGLEGAVSLVVISLPAIKILCTRAVPKLRVALKRRWGISTPSLAKFTMTNQTSSTSRITNGTRSAMENGRFPTEHVNDSSLELGDRMDYDITTGTGWKNSTKVNQNSTKNPSHATSPSFAAPMAEEQNQVRNEGHAGK